jgi:ATP synthase protein I
LSATPARTASQSDAFAQLLRGSLLPTVAAALVCVVVGLVSSPKAAWSAAFGAALVIFFFSLTLLVMKRTADLPPTTVMMVVMATYTFKVIVLGVAMFALRDVSWVSGYAVGVAITVCALVWLFFEMRAYRRLRIFAYDPALAGDAGTAGPADTAASADSADSADKGGAAPGPDAS